MQYHCKDTLKRQSIVYWNCWLAVLLFAWSVDKDVIECYYDIAVIGGDPYHVNQWPLAKAFRTINSLCTYNGLQWITLVDLSNTCCQSANLTSWHLARFRNSSVKIESSILRPLLFATHDDFLKTLCQDPFSSKLLNAVTTKPIWRATLITAVSETASFCLTIEFLNIVISLISCSSSVHIFNVSHLQCYILASEFFSNWRPFIPQFKRTAFPRPSSLKSWRLVCRCPFSSQDVYKEKIHAEFFYFARGHWGHEEFNKTMVHLQGFLPCKILICI